jgi:hypothetical protein
VIEPQQEVVTCQGYKRAEGRKSVIGSQREGCAIRRRTARQE